MKHVFECGIVGESNDEVGDTFLAGMMEIALPQTEGRKLPDDFTLEIHDHDMMRGGMAGLSEMRARYDALCAGMIERGYEWMRWRDEDKFCDCLRFRRLA